MVIASGVFEVSGSRNLNRIVQELKKRGLEIDDIDGEKVLFQIERTTIEEIKSEMDSLRKVESIRNVQISYYSLEDSSGNPDLQSL